jgi:small subunit ribosomal protein S4
MKIGPKYKIARRLGSAVFEKTSTAKFSISEEKRKKKFVSRPRSIYGVQLLEKQKVRFTYGITEKQLSNYVKKTIASKAKNQTSYLYKLLESRLDSIALRSGFATTRRQARQMASHGHLRINETRVNIPSYATKKDDVISVKDSSKNKELFKDFEERFKDHTTPTWLKVDMKNMSVTISGEPEYNSKELHFDLQTVLQFYKR